VVEAVSKGLRLPEDFRAAMGLQLAVTPVVPFTPLGEVEMALQRAVRALDLPGLVARAVRAGYDRARGRV
jgi:hypothetical protein